MKRFIANLCLLFLLGLSWQVGAFSEKDLAKLKATNDCVKCDLSGADLSGARLSEGILFGVNLTGADGSGANLTFTYLNDADLIGADITGATLYEEDLCNTTMPDETINNAGC